MTSSPIPRRSFLTGSSLFAAALALANSARAQEQSKPAPSPADPPKKEAPPKEKPRRGPKTDEEIFAEQEKEKGREELLDGEGREYRICPQCGNKMYRQGRVWTCSNCGYNYVD